MRFGAHQYIRRHTDTVQTENLIFDRTIQALYNSVKENAPKVFDLLLSQRSSALLGFFNYDLPLMKRISDPTAFLRRLGASPHEILGRVEDLNTYRKLFERQLRYERFRPMADAPSLVVSPADSRVVTGAFDPPHPLFIKEKFFRYEELIGPDKPKWLEAFRQGLWAIFRLTPDKYHYNHCPVAGKVADIYEINGKYHSCNPGAVVRSVTPYSKNRRVVTIIDTDTPNGTRAGLVAMVEIVALMIGNIVQCYSDRGYEAPRAVSKGLLLKKGQPKSLFRPGSSTTVLIFQKNRINFSRDLLENGKRADVESRFSKGFGTALVETELNVRETIGKAL